MVEYVLGFCFNDGKSHVVLMNKNRPDWQKGFLNGVGGKVEDNESIPDAMCREFEEETGVKSYPKDWDLCFDVTGYDYKLFIFRAEHDKLFYNVATVTDEEVISTDVIRLTQRMVIHNLHWMIPMMQDQIVSFPIKLDFKGNEK